MKRATLLSFILFLAAVTTVYSRIPVPLGQNAGLPAESATTERARLQGIWIETGGDVVLWIDGDRGHFPAYGCCGRCSESRVFSVAVAGPSKWICLGGYSPIPYTRSGDLLTLWVDVNEVFGAAGNPFGTSHVTMTFKRSGEQ